MHVYKTYIFRQTLIFVGNTSTLKVRPAHGLLYTRDLESYIFQCMSVVCLTLMFVSVYQKFCVWFQTLPATQSMPYACLLRTGATSSLRHSRVLSETIHGNALLYLLLYGGETGGESCLSLFNVVKFQVFLLLGRLC